VDCRLLSLVRWFVGSFVNRSIVRSFFPSPLCCRCCVVVGCVVVALLCRCVVCWFVVLFGGRCGRCVVRSVVRSVVVVIYFVAAGCGDDITVCVFLGVLWCVVECCGDCSFDDQSFWLGTLVS